MDRLFQMRLGHVFFILALLVLIPFLIWGDFFASLFTWEGSRGWLQNWGTLAWAAGILLLVLDLFLPLPNTLVIAALGWKYGVFLGGLIGAFGSMLSGLLAYGLSRKLGRGVARRMISEAEMDRGERLFRRSGGWIVALSRWLPMMPEIIACSAGLARMPLRNFVLALGCGSVPLGFVFAAIGHLGHQNLALATGLSLVLPPVLWLIVQPLVSGASED